MDNGRELANEEKPLNEISADRHRNGETSAMINQPTEPTLGDVSSEPSVEAIQNTESEDKVDAFKDSLPERLDEKPLDNVVEQDSQMHVIVHPFVKGPSDSDQPGIEEKLIQPNATDSANESVIPEDSTPIENTSGEILELEEVSDDVHTEELVNYSKAELVHLLEGLQNEDDLKKTDQVLRQVKNQLEQLKDQERHDALLKFVAEGGDEDDFDFRPDAIIQQIESQYRLLKEKRSHQIKEIEKSKEKNLTAKTSLLERLRQLVDSEETQGSIEQVKEIQKEWKATGSVSPQHGNNVWASYHALIERYYTNRTIYFELKELDRRKNLEAKLEVCEKAEKLASKDPSNAVIKELNELHEEYRHIGPVPRDEQESIWQKFKAASDTIYSRRREQLDGVKREMDQNYASKAELVSALEPFKTFDSQKISDWNEKTQAILEIQKQWNSLGPVSKDKAKEISKEFWHSFKAFFHHKNDFFRKLEEYRAKNLQSKVQLCEQVEALINSEEVEKSAEEVKRLQLEWKNIGPVPEKHKNQIFERFKAACDAFFNRRRENRSETDRQFEENLVRKMQVCQAIEDLAQEHDSDLSKLDGLKAEWASIGFVPRKNMHSIQKRYLDAIHFFAKNADSLSGTQKEKVKLKAELDVSRNNSGAYKNIQLKEQGLRKRITQLENDIALWKNNIEFFSHSKTADKLREEFNEKINVAEKELKEAKSQIKMLNDL
jgi:hypothetical protein